MDVNVIGEITNSEIIASGSAIREIKRLRKAYGEGRWRKLKGIAKICLNDGTVWEGEIHWYEAHNIRKKEIKLKRLLKSFQS